MSKDSPGINDDPMAAEREVYLAERQAELPVGVGLTGTFLLGNEAAGTTMEWRTLAKLKPDQLDELLRLGKTTLRDSAGREVLDIEVEGQAKPTVDMSAQAANEDGVIIIRLPVANLPTVVEGAWAAGGMATRYKVTHEEAFAKDLVRELNWESENGTTRIHIMFDSAIEEAINQGAQGIEKHEEQNQ